MPTYFIIERCLQPRIKCVNKIKRSKCIQFQFRKFLWIRQRNYNSFLIFFQVYVQTVTPEKNLTAVDILFTQKAEEGWVASTAYITGWPILAILIIMVICSLPFVRRGGHFEVSQNKSTSCKSRIVHKLKHFEGCCNFLFCFLKILGFVQQ